jgi:PASTA domain
MNTLTTAAVAAYSQAVRDALQDLPPAKARTILEGLDEHLFEIAEDSATDLETTLGSPQTYAAELRASAGLDTPEPARSAPITAASLTGEPAASTAPATAEPAATTAEAKGAAPGWPPPKENGTAAGQETTASGDTVSPWHTHTGKHSPADVGQLGARIVIGFVFGMLAIVTIRMDWPLNGVKIIGAVLLAVGLHRLLRAAGKRADLPQPLVKWLPGATAVAALATAVLLGGQWARSQQSYRFGDSGGPSSTVFSTMPAPEGSARLPDLTGSDATAAVGVLRSLGFSAQVVDLDPTDPSQRVSRTDPAAGETVSRGSVVLVMRGGEIRPSTTPAPPTSVPTAAAPSTSVASSSPNTGQAPLNTTAAAAPVTPSSTLATAPGTTVTPTATTTGATPATTTAKSP